MLYTAVSVGVPDSILRQSTMARSDYPNLSFPPRCILHALCQPVCTRRDPGGKPSGARVYCPPLRFPQSTLDDSGHNQSEPSLMLQAMQLQSAPTQEHQELSCTENDGCVAAATCGTSQCCSLPFGCCPCASCSVVL